ncbi:MAG: DUF4258 domain-containing protein [Lachnospiraceae bacterium]
MDLKVLKKAWIEGKPVEYTAHCQKRMLERDIRRADIENCILNGEIIEDYPLDDNNTSEKSFPSCLIMGNKISDKKVIHIVVGFNGNKFLIISACYPDQIHWHDDYKTRR